MKQRVALRNDTFAQLQRARANSLPKRRRSRSQLVDSGEYFFSLLSLPLKLTFVVKEVMQLTKSKEKKKNITET